MLLVEHLSEKDYIKYVENKFVENIDFLYREKIIINENSLHTLYFSYIHTYLNYANSACGSIVRKNLKKTIQLTKACNTIINNETRFYNTKKISKSKTILNASKLNIASVAVLMFHIRNKTALNLNNF